MKKLFIVVFIFLVLVTPVIAQQDVEVIPSVNEITILSGETGTIDLNVKNNQNKEDLFSISIFPSFWGKVTAYSEKSILKVSAKYNSTIKIYFSASIEAEEGSQIFSLTATSVSNSSITDSENVRVTVQKKSPVYISNLTLSKSAIDPEETLGISVGIINTANVHSETHTLETIIEKENKVIKKFEDVLSVPARSSKIISNSYISEKYESPGTYSVTSTLKDESNKIVDRKSATFEINAVFRLPKSYTEKIRSFGILLADITIKVMNEGNAPTPEFYITESMPYFAKDFFVPEVEPTLVNKTDNLIAYSWLIPSLNPGEEIVIKYQFRLWTVWIGLLAIVAAVYIIFKITLKPIIVKKYRFISENEILVSLEVKNRSLNEIKDIAVVDSLPSIAQLVEKFDTLKPKAAKVGTKLELRWVLDSLKSREERVLTYRIKPTVGIIGILKLPAAKMSYVDRKKEKKIVISEILTIKSR